MPAAVPAIITLASVSLGGTIAAAIGVSSLFGIALITGITVTAGQLLARKLTPRSELARLQTIENKTTQSIRSTIEPRRIVYGISRVGGVETINISANNNGINTTFDGSGVQDKTIEPGMGINKNNLVLARTLAGHEVESIEAVYFNNRLAWRKGESVQGGAFGDFIGSAFISVYEGFSDVNSNSSDEAFAREIYSTAQKDNDIGVNGFQKGCAKIICILKNNSSLYNGQIPNITALVKGKKVYNPITDTVAFSRNAALIIGDYLTTSEKEGGIGASPDEVYNDNFTQQINICDEKDNFGDLNVYKDQIPNQVPSFINYGEVSRYEINGIVSLDIPKKSVLEDFTRAVGGLLSYTNGIYTLKVAKASASALDINDNDILEAGAVVTNTSIADKYNSVKGTYLEPREQYVAVEYVPISSQAAITADGEEKITDIVQPYIIHYSQARRVAKINLLRNREEVSEEVIVPLWIGLQLEVGDNITRTSEYYGWNAKKFKVYNWQFELTNSDTIGIRLQLKEEGDAVYDWNVSEENAGFIAKNTELPTSTTVLQPENLVGGQKTVDIGNNVQGLLTASWTAPNEPFLNDYVVVVEDPLSNEVFRISTINTKIEIPNLEENKNYTIRVATRNKLGVLSPYSSTVVNYLGLSGEPNDMQNLTFTQISSLVRLSWDQSIDANVLKGGSIKIKFNKDEPNWLNSPVDSEDEPGNTTEAFVNLRKGYYMLKFVTSSGKESANAASVFVDRDGEIDYIDDTVIPSIHEEPLFIGTKQNCVVLGDDLILDDNQLSGEYFFDTTADFGSVKKLKIIAAQKFRGVSGALFDDVPDVDSLASWDGLLAQSNVDCQIFLSYTNDEPNISPVWSPYQKLTSTTLSARAFRFKATLVRGSLFDNIAVEQLRVLFEEKA